MTSAVLMSLGTSNTVSRLPVSLQEKGFLLPLTCSRVQPVPLKYSHTTSLTNTSSGWTATAPALSMMRWL